MLFKSLAIAEQENDAFLFTTIFFFNNWLRLGGSTLFFSQINVFKELHQRITLYPPTFDSFLENPTLNRFPDVLCLDRSRVKLSTKYGNGNYCHASYVDSYERKDGYVFSQAPFSEETEELFWRMVIDVDPKMIVVLGSVEASYLFIFYCVTFQDGNEQMMRCFWSHEGEKIYSNSIRVCLVRVQRVSVLEENIIYKVIFNTHRNHKTCSGNGSPSHRFVAACGDPRWRR
ncbi:unnamed protein product [Angiostrongylus costaricensis]|uniref:Tyrosine-protein phosphatase domain-containing protein n=1 Tax=Angiostrongylus costaricensis TaxID=334426 RepID=A0A0R3PFY3_ANGCS|nr:unnamed protein product [Angiostrongylus costaricensis]